MIEKSRFDVRFINTKSVDNIEDQKLKALDTIDNDTMNAMSHELFADLDLKELPETGEISSFLSDIDNVAKKYLQNNFDVIRNDNLVMKDKIHVLSEDDFKKLLKKMGGGYSKMDIYAAGLVTGDVFVKEENLGNQDYLPFLKRILSHEMVAHGTQDNPLIVDLGRSDIKMRRKGYLRAKGNRNYRLDDTVVELINQDIIDEYTKVTGDQNISNVTGNNFIEQAVRSMDDSFILAIISKCCGSKAEFDKLIYDLKKGEFTGDAAGFKKLRNSLGHEMFRKVSMMHQMNDLEGDKLIKELGLRESFDKYLDEKGGERGIYPIKEALEYFRNTLPD